jgi:hypothetical protein
MCFLILTIAFFPEILLILRGTEQDIIINEHKLSCEVSVILVRLQRNFNFLDIFSKKCFNTKFNENPSSGSRGVPRGRQGGRTDMTKLMFVFAILRTRLKERCLKPTQYGPVSNIFCRLIMVKNTSG